MLKRLIAWWRSIWSRPVPADDIEYIDGERNLGRDFIDEIPKE